MIVRRIEDSKNDSEHQFIYLVRSDMAPSIRHIHFWQTLRLLERS